MSLALEDLIALKNAEKIADSMWLFVINWQEFAKDTIGKQIVRASDSIGANIAEAFGRFNYGEKVQFLYYARGSLFETKYWLNRAVIRNLVTQTDFQRLVDQLSETGKLINRYSNSLKSYKQEAAYQKTSLRENSLTYNLNILNDQNNLLDILSPYDLAFLNSIELDHIP